MFTLRSLPARRASATLFKKSTQLQTSTRALSLFTKSNFFPTTSPQPHPRPFLPPQSRTYATKTSADDLLEQIQDQYATARDEFEIATEETEKNTIYAADDRAAARKELDILKEMFEKALHGQDAEEVRNRVGPRIRELESAVVALEESALHE